MNDPNLIPLFIFGTLLVTGFTLTLIISITIQKQRQVRDRLARQQLGFEYQQALDKSRVEITEHTLGTVAAELHDNIAQALTGCFLQMADLKSRLDTPELKSQAEETKQYLRSVLNDVRVLSHNLATTMVEDRDLQDSIRAELYRLERYGGINCAFSANSNEELDADKRLIVFRIIQEALHNVQKHARASLIAVTIDVSGEQYRIDITDNGRGFDSSIIDTSKSFGLSSMRQRISMIGGMFRIDSAPGEGVHITLIIPYTPEVHGNKDSYS